MSLLYLLSSSLPCIFVLLRSFKCLVTCGRFVAEFPVTKISFIYLNVFYCSICIYFCKPHLDEWDSVRNVCSKSSTCGNTLTGMFKGHSRIKSAPVSADIAVDLLWALLCNKSAAESTNDVDFFHADFILQTYCRNPTTDSTYPNSHPFSPYYPTLHH